MQQETLKEVQFTTNVRVIANDREIQYAKDSGTLSLLAISFIVKIERYGKNKIRELSINKIPLLINRFNSYMGNYPDSVIIPFFQLNKGTVKTIEQIRTIEESQIASNLNYFTFQEINIRQDEGSFLQQLQEVIRKVEGKEIIVLLEIESKRIRQKVEVALALGLKSFMIRGGKYHDKKLWIDLISIVQANNGQVFVSLPRRMHRSDRTSYIKDALEFGADFISHEVLPGRKQDEVLHLHRNFKYAPLSIDSATQGYPEDIRDDIDNGTNYAFSRIRAINLANSLANTVQRIEIV